jgi:hypothetical protein
MAEAGRPANRFEGEGSAILGSPPVRLRAGPGPLCPSSCTWLAGPRRALAGARGLLAASLHTLNTGAANRLLAIWRAMQHALHEECVFYRARQGQGVA